MSGIHQLVPMLHRGDAVGDHTLALQHDLEEAGVESRIYVELEDPETVAVTRRAAIYPDEADQDDLIVYQYATASDLSPWLVSRREPFIVNYHNITPPEFFGSWNDSLAHHQLRGVLDLAHLASRAALGVAVSEFNRGDLTDAGFRATAVVPPIIGRVAPSEALHGAGERSEARGSRWLSVGRLAPNKAVEDTISALAVARSRYDAHATLTVVGKPAIGAYADALRRFTAELGLTDAVTFSGRVSDDELSVAYDEADVLVVASEHEGFCLPIVEAMAHGLPIVAFSAGAVPEVLGDAGVLVTDKSPEVLAGEIQRLGDNASWRQGVVEAGRQRLPQLHLEQAGSTLVALLRALHAGKAELPGVSVNADA